jgi:hypothetical protein
MFTKTQNWEKSSFLSLIIYFVAFCEDYIENYTFLITWITNIVTNNKLHIIANNFSFSDEVHDYKF